MSVKADAVLAILQSRYDYYSARAVLSSAALSTGISKTGPFDDTALATLADAIRAADDSASVVAESVRNAGSAKAAPKAAKSAPAAKPAAEKPAPKKAEPKQPAPAPKADAPKADAADKGDAADKADDKAPAKKTSSSSRRGAKAKAKG